MKKYLTILLCTLLCSCVKQEVYRGYNFDNADFNKIVVGKTTKQELINELGSPTTRADFGPDIIYYVSAKYEKVAFFDPKVVEQRVLAFEFNSKSILSSVKELDYDDFRSIETSDRAIEMKGNTLSPYQQIMSNIGKFKPKGK